MPTCAVKHCKSRKYLHKIPKGMREEWFKSLNIDVSEKSVIIYVCQNHFSDDDFFMKKSEGKSFSLCSEKLNLYQFIDFTKCFFLSYFVDSY